MMGERILENEHADAIDRRYAYDFDYRMHSYMIRTFEPFVGTDALEMGCYHGDFTKLLVERFVNVTVVEGARDLIEIAKSRVGEARFCQSRFETFSPQSRFDAVFLIHTLEHLDEPQGVLPRIRAWLKPDGLFYVAVPNAHAASRQIAVEMGLISHPTAVTDGEFAHGHRRTYELSALIEEMQRAGFEVRASGGIFFKPFANFQFDKLISSDAIGEEYLEGCYRLGTRYPDLCASIYAVCSKGSA
jgi:trans-aconitate methyltransferase